MNQEELYEAIREAARDVGHAVPPPPVPRIRARRRWLDRLRAALRRCGATKRRMAV